MAGVAAGLTNNGRGIAGVCPSCNILDINATACAPECVWCGFIMTDEHYPHECNNAVVATWFDLVADAIDAAMTDPIPADLVVLNLTMNHSLDYRNMPVLWNAHLRGIVTVWASGNFSNEFPDGPAFVPVWPWCIGAGGYN
jgi:hypothetical protein